MALSSITLSGLMVAGKFKDVFKPAMETENAQVRIIRVLENGYGWSREEAKKAVKGITDELSEKLIRRGYMRPPIEPGQE